MRLILKKNTSLILSIANDFHSQIQLTEKSVFPFMETMKRIYLFIWGLALVGMFPLSSGESQRIVSLNGSLTELIYQLGAGSEIVGVDTTSTFPAENAKLPQVGYQRALSTEGIASLTPTRILGTDAAGPPHVLEQLKTLQLPLFIWKDVNTLSGLEEKIRNVSKFIGREKEGNLLVKALKEKMNQVKIQKLKKPIKVLFVYSRGNSNIFTGGSDTPADVLIQLSGGTNAMTGFSDFKPLTPESIVSAQPDILLVPKKSLESMGGERALWELPSIQLTRAGKEKNLITLEDIHLLGLGVRLPEVIQELNRKWKSLD